MWTTSPHTRLALIASPHLFLSAEDDNIAAEDMGDGLDVPFMGLAFESMTELRIIVQYLHYAASSMAAEIRTLQVLARPEQTGSRINSVVGLQ